MMNPPPLFKKGEKTDEYSKSREKNVFISVGKKRYEI